MEEEAEKLKTLTESMPAEEAGGSPTADASDVIFQKLGIHKESIIIKK